MKTKEELIQDRDNAISEARWILMNPYFVVDTETTGLDEAQMCQIAILEHDGTQYKSLIKPTIPIEEEATKVHGITDEDVIDAPDAPTVIVHLPLYSYLLAYNAQFDWKVINQSLKAHDHYLSHNYEIHDVMKIYSAFAGFWDDYHGNYKWHKLAAACSQCGIEAEIDSTNGFHDAMYDVIMTDKLLKYISIQKLSTEV